MRKMKQSKTLILTVPLMIILLGLVFYQYGYLSMQESLESIKDEEAIKVKTLERYVSLISERPQIEKTLEALKEIRASEETKFIEGQTPPLAAANLQDIVKNIIIGYGGAISSERIGKPEELMRFKVITVSIDAIIPTSAVLSDIVYAIETKTPYLVISDLDIRVRNFREPRELLVKLDVSAIMSGK